MVTPESLEAEYQRVLPTKVAPYFAGREVLERAGIRTHALARLWYRVDPGLGLSLPEMFKDPLLRATVWITACEMLRHANT